MQCTRLLNDHILAQRAMITKQDDTIRRLQKRIVAYEQECGAHNAEMAAIKEEISELKTVLARLTLYFRD